MEYVKAIRKPSNGSEKPLIRGFLMLNITWELHILTGGVFRLIKTKQLNGLRKRQIKDLQKQKRF